MKLNLFQGSRGALALCLLAPASRLWCSARCSGWKGKGAVLSFSLYTSHCFQHDVLNQQQGLYGSLLELFIGTLWVNLRYLRHPVWWEWCQNPRTPVTFLKLLQDFACSCSQPYYSPALMQCRVFKRPSCSASSHVGRVFWRHLTRLCWLESTQDWFTPAGLPGCVSPTLNKAGCDICLESTRGHLIHVFLLWLTT